MAHLAQMAQDGKSRLGNTNSSRLAKCRNWVFTLNNYMDSEVINITELKCKYVFQKEKGENGTPHLQGLLMFKNAVSFNSVKKMIPRGHIERCNNMISSIKYCTKPETRDGEIYHNCEELTKYWHNGTPKIQKIKSGSRPPPEYLAQMFEQEQKDDKIMWEKDPEYRKLWKEILMTNNKIWIDS